MVKPYLNQIGGNVEEDVAMFTGGLNTYTDKAFLDADQMPYVMNMCMYKPPMLATRNSRVTWAKMFENYFFDGNDYPIIAIYVYKENDIFLITQVGNTQRFERYYQDGNHLTKQVVDTLPYTYDRYYFAYCPVGVHKYLYIGNENCKMRVDLDAEPGNPLVLNVYSDNHYGIPVWHKSRLWLARPSTNIIEWSNALQPDDFTTDQSHFAGELYVTKKIGNIVNIISFDDKLMVFCEHSIHCVYGDSGNPSNQNFFQLVDVSNNLGLLSPDCLAIGGERLFFLGDNKEVYEYTGSSIRIISRPGRTRNETISVGGVSGLIDPRDVTSKMNWAQYMDEIPQEPTEDYNPIDYGVSISKFVATSEKLYINTWNACKEEDQKILLVFDIYNRTWWCEDGEFTNISNYSDYNNRIALVKANGDILITEERPTYDTSYDGIDQVFSFEDNKILDVPISYEFHTRVYGADGTDLRETLPKTWFQARAEADIYLNDIWTSLDVWNSSVNLTANLVKIGSLKYKTQLPTQTTEYRPDTYEQQVTFTPKMYGQRLNTFQIIVKGTGASRFYLMKRDWRAR